MDAIDKPVVIVVDDELAIVDAMAMILEDRVDLHTARDGQSALLLIASGIRPDVLISDYRMRGLNGVEVVQKAREMIGGDVPAVIMTGDTSEQTIRDTNLRRCSVLKKPFGERQLIEAIDSVM